jgi:hypothetical protein
MEGERQAGAARRWLLPNLGAEESQAVPKSARGFLRGLYGAWATLFSDENGAPLLLHPGDQEAYEAWRKGLAPGSWVGAALPALDALWPGGGLVAWLNTPAAVEVGRSHRLPLLGAPPDATLDVHDKAFAQRTADELALHPECLRGHVAIFSAEACADVEGAAARLVSVVSGFPAWTGRRFVIKPRLSTSGRHRVIATLTDDGIEPPIADAAWRLFAARGGCIVEPWLARLQDLSLQMIVQKDAVKLLGTTAQLVTRSGQILGNRGILDGTGALRAGCDAAIEAQLFAAATRLGGAAARRGFFGVAGVDAFTFRGPDGAPVLRPVVEMNARFTTGTVALGLVRRLVAAGRAKPGGAWALVLKAPDRDALPDGVDCLCPLPRGPALLWAQSPSLLIFGGS